MKYAIRMTGPVQQILRATLADPAASRYGLEMPVTRTLPDRVSAGSPAPAPGHRRHRHRAVHHPANLVEAEPAEPSTTCSTRHCDQRASTGATGTGSRRGDGLLASSTRSTRPPSPSCSTGHPRLQPALCPTTTPASARWPRAPSAPGPGRRARRRSSLRPQRVLRRSARHRLPPARRPRREEGTPHLQLSR